MVNELEKPVKEISAALVKAQRNFAPALKTATNPHFRSQYADLSACIEAVVDALNAAGIMLMQKQHQWDGGVAVETVFVHESGETMSAGILSLPATKQDAQGYGSALTYARRYSLMAACGIAPEDDDGNAASKKAKAADNDNGSPGALMFKELQPEIQDMLRKAAPQIDAAMPHVDRAMGMIEMCVDNWPDADAQQVKAGLWYLLNSKTRSAIKAHTKAAV
jgi:predicted RecA/RadA family phage recombinase